MQCNSYSDIQEETGIPESTAQRIVEKYMPSQNSHLAKLGQDFTPQLYNIWHFSKNNNETKHFGNVPVEIVEVWADC